MRRIAAWFPCILALLLTAGPLLGQTGGATFEEEKAQATRFWATRDDPADCARAIEHLKAALALDPAWEEGWVWLSWAYYWDGNHQPESDKEGRKARHQAGMDAGKKATALNENSVGGHFWYIVNKAAYGRARGIVASVSYLPEILRVTERVEKLDASYFYGGVFRLYARIIYETPAWLRKAKGYSIEDAEKELRKGLSYENKFALTHLYLADVLAEMGRMDEAKKELEYVLSMPEDAIPGMEAEVRKDKKVAAQRMKDLFPGG